VLRQRHSQHCPCGPLETQHHLHQTTQPTSPQGSPSGRASKLGNGKLRISIAHAVAPPGAPRDLSPDDAEPEVIEAIRTVPLPPGPLQSGPCPGSNAVKAERQTLHLAAAMAPPAAATRTGPAVAEALAVGIQPSSCLQRGSWPDAAEPSQAAAQHRGAAYCISCGLPKYDKNGKFCAYCGVRFP